MKLSEILTQIRTRLGIESLNAMQEKVVATDSATNLVLLSPTGSGKTVAFATAMLKTLPPPSGSVAATVIAPSRELVVQIYRVVRELAAGYKVVALYGGHSMADEKNSLRPVPDIVVATPGRLLDHVNRGNIDLYTTRVLVLDEYDKSLELGFHDEMSRLVRTMPNLKRTLLISATRLPEMPPFMTMKRVETLDFLPEAVAAGSDPRRRTQVVEVASPVADKLETLGSLLASLPNGKVIVFVNHRESAQRVYQALRAIGLPAGIYHGALEQPDREKAVDLLNNGTTPILVSTDLGARGLDIDGVQAIVHYHMPTSQEAWTHRNGRTARVDASGTVYVITSEADSVPDYVRFDRAYVPTGRSDDPIRATAATLYFNAGKKEKISRGDIAGFLMKQGGLSSGEVGRIIVRDHSSLAAVPVAKVGAVLAAVGQEKLKGKRVRISRMV